MIVIFRRCVPVASALVLAAGAPRHAGDAGSYSVRNEDVAQQLGAHECQRARLVLPSQYWYWEAIQSRDGWIVYGSPAASSGYGVVATVANTISLSEDLPPNCKKTPARHLIAANSPVATADSAIAIAKKVCARLVLPDRKWRWDIAISNMGYAWWWVSAIPDRNGYGLMASVPSDGSKPECQETMLSLLR